MTHQPKAGAEFWKSNLREYGLLVSLLVIMGFFEILTGGVLLDPINITNLILQNSYVVIMSLGMLLIIVGGNIDLSVGAIVGFVGAVAATSMATYKAPWELVVCASLVLGAVIGAAQGYLVAFSRIPAFIVTLGGMLILRGLTGNMLLGQYVGPFPKAFQSISSGFVSNIFVGGRFNWTAMISGILGVVVLLFATVRRWRAMQSQLIEIEPLALVLGKNAVFALLIVAFSYLLSSYKGLPNVLVIMVALVFLYGFVTTRTTIGRRVYALGGNPLAAKLSGVRTERLVLLTFVNMGILAGLAGLIVAARLNSATPTAGFSYELDVIAACFIGGVSAAGGVGKVMGVVIGAFLMGVMNNGMSIYGLGTQWQLVVKGVVLLSAIYMNVYQKNKG